MCGFGQVRCLSKYGHSDKVHTYNMARVLMAVAVEGSLRLEVNTNATSIAKGRH